MKQKMLDKWIGSVILSWAIPIILFWLMLSGAPMLFFLIVYTWYPLLAGITSYLVVSKNKFGVWKWSTPLIISILNTSVCYVTYGITNALGMSKVAWSDVGNFVFNGICAVIGFIIGIVVFRYKRKSIA